jgi:hypothetical protein
MIHSSDPDIHFEQIPFIHVKFWVILLDKALLQAPGSSTSGPGTDGVTSTKWWTRRKRSSKRLLEQQLSWPNPGWKTSLGNIPTRKK